MPASPAYVYPHHPYANTQNIVFIQKLVCWIFFFINCSQSANIYTLLKVLVWPEVSDSCVTSIHVQFPIHQHDCHTRSLSLHLSYHELFLMFLFPNPGYPPAKCLTMLVVFGDSSIITDCYNLPPKATEGQFLFVLNYLILQRHSGNGRWCRKNDIRFIYLGRLLHTSLS